MVTRRRTAPPVDGEAREAVLAFYAFPSEHGSKHPLERFTAGSTWRTASPPAVAILS